MSADVKTSPKFTPTEELILDVLVARYRLGDAMWNFEARNMATLRKLEEKGLIHANSGVVENTVNAWLTDRALRDHGASWFRISNTMEHLPADGARNHLPGNWAKSHLEKLVELPQQVCATDPGAINAAHILMIQMIQRHHPVHQVLPGADGGVVLKRGADPDDADAVTIGISADGEIFQLYRKSGVEDTRFFSDALYFTSAWSK
ncbi:hypothetical protein WMO79_00865 [Micrococcaceae bacterium Sec7.4]